MVKGLSSLFDNVMAARVKAAIHGIYTISATKVVELKESGPTLTGQGAE
jgi:hypothetical protein